MLADACPSSPQNRSEVAQFPSCNPSTQFDTIPLLPVHARVRVPVTQSDLPFFAEVV